MRRILLTITIFFLSCACVTSQTIRFVPSDSYETIQSAIDAAVDGDTVEVSLGTYYENIVFFGKNITLTSVDPTNPQIVAETIIDGSHPSDVTSGSVISCTNSETSDAVITGFTIQNGTGRSDPSITWRVFNSKNGDGGGILCVNSSPTITYNVFKNNSVNYGGAGIFCHNNASPIISYNTFIDNYAGWYGGAIFGRVNCSPEITYNTFISNTCKYLGGAIYLADGSYSIISHNYFEQNSCQDLYGGAIYSFIRSSPAITCNIFTANTCTGSYSNRPAGSAILLEANQGATANCLIINNLFTQNATINSPASTVKIADAGPNYLLANNIFSNNLDLAIAKTTSADVTIVNNCFWQNTLGNFSENIGDLIGVNGNIEADPNFAPALPDPFSAGRYELNPDSACIDAGSNDDLPAWLTTDFAGRERILGSSVDIGPQEFSAICVPQDFATIQSAIEAAENGDEIIVSSGFYQENLDFGSKNVRLRSLDPLDADLVGKTIIDGNNVDSCIKIIAGQDETAAVAGFRIQNGYGEFGGGVHIGNYSSPRVMYNFITTNRAQRYGGGIDNRDHSHANIACNTIVGNYAKNAGGGVHNGPGSHALVTNNRIIANSTDGEAGGGIYSFSKTTIDIIGNKIIGNTAGPTNGGGGIWLWDNVDSLVAGNLIMANSTWGQENVGGVARGGGIGMQDGTAVIQNNLICGNKAALGGGLSLHAGAYGQIVNNTLIGNIATEHGAGVCVAYSANGPIINNIIAFNNEGGGIYVMPSATSPSEPAIVTNTLWDNIDGDYVGDIDDLTGINNISADPVFLNAGGWVDNGTTDVNDDYWLQGDYHIGYYSPCRDSGTLYEGVVSDFAGNNRPALGGVDVGAYELQCYDLTVSGSVDFGDLATMAEYWLLKRENLPGDLNGDGFVGYRDFALLVSQWGSN